jgi:ribokinase
MQRILVIGSSNTDMVVKAAKLPGPGETVLGGSFLMTPGGKGANQAMAAQRLLPERREQKDSVIFVAKVGDDLFGQQARRGFEEEGLDTRFVYQDSDAPSGVALIGVDERGENSIMVAPGANAHLTAGEVSGALDALPEAEWLLIQLEVPMETVAHSIREGARKGLKVVLNPAPAATIPEELFASLYLITPNETEAELLTGVAVSDRASAREAAQILHQKGAKNVIITLGAKGAFLYHAEGEALIPAPLVTPFDTTAAGDVFNGALVVALAEQRPLPDAIRFACQAAALSVTRMGAQASIPQRAEVNESLSKN